MQTTATGLPTTAAFSINMNSITSTDNKIQKENTKVDLQLKSADFFEVSRFPTAVMVVKKIVPTKTPSLYAINGDLTMKGVVNPVYFNAMIKISNNEIRVTAKFQIDRMKWNVKNTNGNFFGEKKYVNRRGNPNCFRFIFY